MADDNKVVFEEKQNQPLYIRLGFPLFMLAIAVWVFVSEPSFDIWMGITAAIIFMLIAAMFTTPKLITRVDSYGVSMRRRFTIYSKISFQDVISAQESSYKCANKEHDGFSLFASAAYFYIGDKGVLIRHNETKLTFVSSKRANELAAAINDGRQQYEQSKYV